MSTRIDALWRELEEDQSAGVAGMLYRRFSSQIGSDIYVALKSPGRFRCVAARLGATADLDIERINSLREISVESIPDQQHPGKFFLLILLVDPHYNDTFSALAEDLMNRVADLKDENLLIRELLNRLAQWQSLFDKARSLGLSEEAQIGLYGELCFLRKLLGASQDPRFCVDAWKGSEHAAQDFQYSDWAVEVKTTQRRDHLKMQVSSERQLDTTFIRTIFLFHTSVDVREESGETLNEVVDAIAALMEPDEVAANSLKVKLMNAGFFDAHRGLYSHRGYGIRRERIFLVSDDFPRIVESRLPAQISEVSYSITIGDDAPWASSEDQLFLRIGRRNA